jgi:hypothetical protein
MPRAGRKLADCAFVSTPSSSSVSAWPATAPIVSNNASIVFDIIRIL